MWQGWAALAWGLPVCGLATCLLGPAARAAPSSVWCCVPGVSPAAQHNVLSCLSNTLALPPLPPAAVALSAAADRLDMLLLLHVASGVSAAPSPHRLCFTRVHSLRGVAELRLSMLSLAWSPAEQPEHCARCTQL